MKKPRLTDRIRAALAGNGQQAINLLDLADKLGVQTKADMEKIRWALKDMVKQGEVEKVGVNLYKPLVRQPGQPTKQEVMWRVLRARRSVTIADLQELADVSRHYAQEFMRSLVKRGVVQQTGTNGASSFRLVADQVEAPKNEDKAEYLRRRREVRKKALAALDAVFAAVAEARMAIAGIEDASGGDGD